MNNLIYQTYIIALPIILTALLGYIVWLLQEQKKQKAIDTKERNERIEEEKKLRQANGKGTMLLLRVQLIEYHDKYMKLGEIPSYAYQNFCEMYDAYHALGGNGMVTKMKNEIEKIHLGKVQLINVNSKMRKNLFYFLTKKGRTFPLVKISFFERY